MANDAEKRIRDRAYHLWEAAGRPHGRDSEFWHEASRAERENAVGTSTAKPKKAKASPAAKQAKASAKSQKDKTVDPAKPKRARSAK